MAAVTPTRTAPPASGRDHFVRQATALSWRAVVRFARQPSSWIPATVFPLLLVAVNSSAMGRVDTTVRTGSTAPSPLRASMATTPSG